MARTPSHTLGLPLLTLLTVNNEYRDTPQQASAAFSTCSRPCMCLTVSNCSEQRVLRDSRGLHRPPHPPRLFGQAGVRAGAAAGKFLLLLNMFLFGRWLGPWQKCSKAASPAHVHTACFAKPCQTIVLQVVELMAEEKRWSRRRAAAELRRALDFLRTFDAPHAAA